MRAGRARRININVDINRKQLGKRGKRRASGRRRIIDEKKLIERLVIIILKVGCGGDGDDEEINITRLYR